jgi:glycosyltransferase involved in cell wall biosynthesis
MQMERASATPFRANTIRMANLAPRVAKRPTMPAKGTTSERGMKVLLIGNYSNDEQESMRRFADLLAQQLPSLGISAECLCPSPVFGRLRRGAGGIGKWLGYLDKFVLFPRVLRKRIRQFDSETLVHICDHSNAVYTQVLAGVPHLVTCHDLLAIRSALGEFPGHRVRVSGRLYQRRILHGLNAARRVACISRATHRDILRLTTLAPGQVSLVHNGLNHSYAPLTERDVATRLREAAPRLGHDLAARLQGGFILHVGGNQWYKNRLGLIQIYARLCEKMLHAPKLVLAGKPFTPQLRREILSHNLEDRVIALNSVSNEDLRTLYCAAQLLLFPSLEEGFGWPIIEAQACGCRVVIADREPMTEVGGDAAVCFKLESHTTLENASLSNNSADGAATVVMKTLLENRDERLDRVRSGLRNAAKFSTARMVENYIELYRRISVVGAARQLHNREPLLEPQ